MTKSINTENKDDNTLRAVCLDILKDLLTRFGAEMATEHKGIVCLPNHCLLQNSNPARVVYI